MKIVVLLILMSIMKLLKLENYTVRHFYSVLFQFYKNYNGGRHNVQQCEITKGRTCWPYVGPG